MPLLLIAVLLFLASPVFTEDVTPRINTKDLEVRIHDLINMERHNAGLRPFVLDKKLCVVARSHSKDMAERNYFSHINHEGEDFLSRYRKNGVVCGVRVGRSIYLGGENIFCNNLYSSIIYTGGRAHYNWNSLEEIARSTVKGWMKSHGHKKNILHPVFRSQGIGITIKDGKVYVTEDFC